MLFFQSSIAVEGYCPKGQGLAQQVNNSMFQRWTLPEKIGTWGQVLRRPGAEDPGDPGCDSVNASASVRQEAVTDPERNDQIVQRLADLQVHPVGTNALETRQGPIRSCGASYQPVLSAPSPEEEHEFDRVVDLGPEHGGLQDVDASYLEVAEGPLRVNASSGREAADAASTDSNTDSSDEGVELPYFEMPTSIPNVSTISPFGRLYMALDSWVTSATIQFVHHGSISCPENGSAVHDLQSFQVLSGHMNRALATITRRLRVKVTSSEVEMMLFRLLATFKFDCPVPCLSVAEWQVVVAVILRALSATLLPKLRGSFEGEEALRRVDQMLRPVGLDESRFDALGFVFSEDRQL